MCGGSGGVGSGDASAAGSDAGSDGSANVCCVSLCVCVCVCVSGGYTPGLALLDVVLVCIAFAQTYRQKP